MPTSDRIFSAKVSMADLLGRSEGAIGPGNNKRAKVNPLRNTAGSLIIKNNNCPFMNINWVSFTKNAAVAV
jgi:hypothetical protein